MRFSAALEGYWLARRRNLSANTVRDYTVTFTRFQEFLAADPELGAITSADVNRFLNHLRADLNHSPKTFLNRNSLPGARRCTLMSLTSPPDPLPSPDLPPKRGGGGGAAAGGGVRKVVT